MSGFAGPSRTLALALALVSGAGRADDAPRRVVSMNVCTDQLAMLVAGEGQLLSVSWLAGDPRVSAMSAEAAGYPQNHGRAEEVFLLQPDLVLVGAYAGREAADMLRRLGVRVEVFEPEAGLADIPDRIRQMGRALGREERAEALVAEFEVRLALLRQAATHRPRAALYFANGYTSGVRSLAGEILAAAGFANVAEETGHADGGIMPLEVLVMAEPDALITGETYPGASRSEAILDHPAVAGLRARAAGATTDSDWVCGTPHVLRAVERLVRLRENLPS